MTNTGTDPEQLLHLHQAAILERIKRNEAVAVTAPEIVEARQPASRRPSRRTAVFAVVTAVMLFAVLTVVVALRSGAAGSRVRITSPRGSVGQTTAVEGTVTGLADDDLWLDVQSSTEERHHLIEEPCQRHGNKFSFDPLYVGRPVDTGVVFRISVVATRRGSAAEQALIAYGQRSKTAPGAYDGLEALPSGATTVTTVEVTRGH